MQQLQQLQLPNYAILNELAQVIKQEITIHTDPITAEDKEEIKITGHELLQEIVNFIVNSTEISAPAKEFKETIKKWQNSYEEKHLPRALSRLHNSRVRHLNNETISTTIALTILNELLLEHFEDLDLATKEEKIVSIYSQYRTLKSLLHKLSLWDPSSVNVMLKKIKINRIDQEIKDKEQNAWATCMLRILSVIMSFVLIGLMINEEFFKAKSADTIHREEEFGWPIAHSKDIFSILVCLGVFFVSNSYINSTKNEITLLENAKKELNVSLNSEENDKKEEPEDTKLEKPQKTQDQINFFTAINIKAVKEKFPEEWKAAKNQYTPFWQSSTSPKSSTSQSTSLTHRNTIPKANFSG